MGNIVNTRIISLLLLVLACSSQVSAQNREHDSTGELALSNDTLELRYIGGGESVGANRGSQFSGAFFLSEDRDIVLSAALLFPTNLDLGRLSLTVGPQVYAALLNEENNDVLSITLGTEVRFLLNRSSNLAIVGRAFYGPDILTFGSADNLTDLSARVELEIAPRVVAFGGMRWFEFDLTEGQGEQTLQEEVFVGAGYRF